MPNGIVVLDAASQKIRDRQPFSNTSFSLFRNKLKEKNTRQGKYIYISILIDNMLTIEASEIYI